MLARPHWLLAMATGTVAPIYLRKILNIALALIPAGLVHSVLTEERYRNHNGA